jgi:dihydropteroate synthase
MWAGLSLDRPRLMGILNVTPDSFSDGGAYHDPAAAIEAGRVMLADGADILDIGGESTRPGAKPVSPDEEQARILPVIRALAREGALISVDTRNAATMEAALDAGAAIVNDVSGLTHDPVARALVARRGCPVVLMHMRGTPETMASLAHYDDVVRDVVDELRQRIAEAVAAGIRPEAIAVDPGLGFAKTAEQSVALLQALGTILTLQRPIVVGVSRKSFIGRLSNEPEPRRRLGGSLAAALYAAMRGASLFRVHDVHETVQAFRVWHNLAA